MADLQHDRRTRDEALAVGDLTTLVELLFFAYRDFTGEADALLEAYGLGRAHHRVLHFVRRHPGLRVTELLAILKITKQSLARVLTPLIDDGWIDSRKDPEDARARLLVMTPKGLELATRLADLQIARIAKALGPDRDGGNPSVGLDEVAVRRFLFAMIAEEDRARVLSLISKTPPAATARPRTR